MTRSLRYLGLLLLACGMCSGATGLALAEPAGRTFEMVSPVYKAGYEVESLEATSSDGEKAAFRSRGAFAGAQTDVLVNAYVAHRTEGGWQSAPVNPPADVWPYANVSDYSLDLSLSLIYTKPGGNVSTLFEGEEVQFLTLDTDLPDYAENFELVGETLVLRSHKIPFTVGYDLGDPEFAHVVFEPFTGESLLPPDNSPYKDPYDLSRAGLRLVDVNNKGKLITPCGVSEIGSRTGKESQLNAVSSDGSEVFFMADVKESASECATDEQVFLRLAGTRTLEISRPLNASKAAGGCVGQADGVAGEVPCAGAIARKPAEFQGASANGSRVYLTTQAPLAGSDTDEKSDLYMATIECPSGGMEGCAPAAREVRSVVQVSHASEPADVQGVVAVAHDGSRIYFVARGVLSAANASGLSPVKGADNLYVFESDNGGGRLAFVADMCSGPEASGEAGTTACPPTSTASDSDLWLAPRREAEVNECAERSPSCEEGQFLVFASYAKISRRDDTDEAKDVYRYDAATETLVRISAGEDGYDANGNDSAHDATISLSDERGNLVAQHDTNNRAISEDGSRAIFFATEPLSPAAGNGLTDLYEWHENAGGGEVRLVSPGNADRPVPAAVVSSNGRDVFFMTSQGLVREDTDGQLDLYDAREGGGFPRPESPLQPCREDACQGPLTDPAPMLVPASASTMPGDNYKPVKKGHAKRHRTRGRHRPKKRRLLHKRDGGAKR